MSYDPSNPYQPPTAQAVPQGPSGIDAESLRKIEAIIKDAGQFWLAILLCFLCTGIGALVIGPWYIVRLVQWNSMAQQFPVLMDPHAPPASLGQRFQSSKWKLIVGLCFGAFIFLMVMLLVLVAGA